ncbi:MAG: caspase family protein [Anaerolineae bacterium]|nr:caspase family protein [Anaerolineae bacterium]
MSPNVSETATTRATLVNAPGRYRPDIERWAIVVGISDYQHKELNLKWAHRDAEEVHKLLLTPAGGSFAADHIQLLVNEAATTQAISRALRSFLQKPAEEDVVLIYFACHGGPDPGRTSNLYLWTYDTDPNDIAGSALPMREIDLSLRENLLAERVVILADTCHSGGLGGGIGRRRRLRKPAS